MTELQSTPPPPYKGEPDKGAPDRGGVTKKILPLAAIGLLLILFFALGWHKEFAPDRLLANLENLSGWIEDNRLLAVMAFIAVYTGAVAISFPGATILTIAGGFLFGQWLGTASVVIAATSGAVIIFILAKTAFGDSLASKAGGFVKKMEQGFREDELNYMFLLRLVPAFPFFAVNIAAGLLNVKLQNYVIGTFFGIIPGSFVYVSIGNAISKGTATLADTGLVAVFQQPAVYLPFIGLAALGALPIILKKIGVKKNA
ncbi:MAG: TVP38/TMEM64 family protein [Pseudomonadota bacterium]